MYKQQYVDHFIGRSEEIDTFTRWLSDPNAPWILYVHDAAKEDEKKGGVGKTWLLHRCADLVRQIRQDTVVVRIDFFNVGDRDSLFLAERIMAGLQELYPGWAPTSFTEAIRQYWVREHQTASALESTESFDDKGIREVAFAALVDDLRRLDTTLAEEQKTLLVFFDTFEAIEQNPAIAVLRQSQTFPDNYQFERMRVVIAGRNRLDWAHPNWRGREQEVQTMALAPFNQQEMLEYVETESGYDIAFQSEQANALYVRTEGRPIIVGLVIDVLNNRIQTLDELIAVPQTKFENYLVPQVNKLENPLNWVILFMAHVYHHFNMSILEWVLRSVELSEPVRSISPERLSEVLPRLSFVRLAGSGGNFVLHDEMRRLVTKYCWEIQDTDRRYRKDISRSIINYYAREIARAQNEQQRQGWIIGALYHRLFIDLNEGLNYFQQHFRGALYFLKLAFARLLLQETQKFTDQLSLRQHSEIQLAEVALLRSEENPAAALAMLHQLKHEADPQWYEEHQSDFFIEEGRCYQQQSKFREAANSFTQSLTIAQARKDELESAQLLNNLGFVFRRRGEHSTALSYYEKSIALYKKLGRQDEYTKALTNISDIYRRQGKIEEALRKCKYAWRIRTELFREGKISEVQVGLSLLALGVIYMYAGDIIQAEQHFQAAFDIFLRVNYKAGIARIQNRLGHIQLLKGELESAREWFIQAQEASLEIEIEQYINSLNKQGRVYARQHEWAEAVTFFEQAIVTARRVPDYYQQTESLVDLADALGRLEQAERAQQPLQEAEDIATREEYVFLLGLIEQTRGEICYRAGDYMMAFQHFVLYCGHMAHYNSSEFSIAVRKLVDALLGVPKSDVPAIVQEVLTYWTSHQLDKDYPELIRAVEDAHDFMFM
jgi:tetratricopeptide (TPR) repeat protein